jgi:N4-gp56 family major capsid protein
MAEITYAEITAILGKAEWVTGLQIDAMLESFFGPGMRGAPGSNLPIIRQPVPGGRAGVAIDVPLLGNLDGEGQTGEGILEGNEEEIANSHQVVTPSLYRHGVCSTGQVRWSSAVDLATFARSGLSSWAGRKQDRLIFSAIVATAPRLYGGDATSRATLGTNDTFGTAELTRGRLHLQRIGAKPLRIEMDAQGRKISYYGCVVSAIDEAALKSDPTWQMAHARIAELGANNPLFSGAVGEWDGVIVYPYSELAGSGSPLRPETTVASTGLAIDATTINVGGGRPISYTKYFPTAGTLLIGNEQITYTGTTATSFTGCTRGANASQAAIHASGALITLNNLTTQVFFGAEAIAEGEGQAPTFVTNERDYGNRQGIGVLMIDGYQVVINTSGNPANLIVMECYGVSPS